MNDMLRGWIEATLIIVLSLTGLWTIAWVVALTALRIVKGA